MGGGKVVGRALLMGGVWIALWALPTAASSPWSHFDKTTGLVDNTVQTIVSDRDGELWIGTRGGLSRFDGEQWRNLTKEQGLPDDDINSIYFGPDGQAWIGTKRGFGLYRDGEWSRLGLPGAREGERVSVVADATGVIWFGYGGGLMRFDPETARLTAVPELEGTPVTALLSAGEGELWAGTAEGLEFFDDYSWKHVGDRQGLPSGAVTALLKDTRGTVWAGTEKGLAEYDGIGWTAYGGDDDMPNLHVTSLAEDREGRIWVGTRGGAGWYDGYEWIWVGRDEGIPSEEVLALCADRNGSIWVGTSHGLVKYDTSWARLPALTYDEKLPRAPLLKGGEGVVRIGTDEGFLLKEGRTTEWVGPAEGLEGRPTVMVEDGEGVLWVGTEGGLFLYDRGVDRHILPPEPVKEFEEREHGGIVAVWNRYFDRYSGLKDERVTALAEEPGAGVWVGTAGGLSRFDGRMWDLLEENEILGRGEITALAGNGESLWAGTPEGLWVRGGEEWTKVASRGSPGGRKILSLFHDGIGVLWVGTDGGAFRWDGSTWERFAGDAGPVGDQVLSLFQDQGGVMWFGTDAGVAKYDGSHWSAFSEADGLHANGITSIAEAGRELWFGSPGGVTIYRPDQAPPDTRVKNVPRDVVGSSSLLFDFAGSDLETLPHLMRYSWRLDDGEWSPFSDESMVTLSDLVNGTHFFAVRSMDQGLNVDPAPATITFQVDTGIFDLELVDAHFSELYASLYQFYAADRDYRLNPVASVRIRNKFDRPLRVKVSVFIPGLMDFPTDHVVTVGPGQTLPVPLRIELSEEVLSLEKTATRQALVTMQYNLRGELKESASTHSVTIFEAHSMTWDEPGRIGLYVTHLDEVVENFARDVVSRFREDEKSIIIYDNLLRAIEIFDGLGAYGVHYIADPENPYGGFTTGRPVLDLIRYPRETLQAGAGDCDDVSVLYASLLQNIGIDTALVDAYDHVFVMFDTGLKGHQARQLTRDDALLHIDGQDRIWIPVEVTLLGGTFTEAWRTGAQVMRERPYEVLEIKEAWKKYAPLHLTGEGPPVVAPGREEIWTLFREDVRLQEQTLISREARELQTRLREDPADRRALNSLGVLLAKNGYLRQAAERFLRVVELLPEFPGGYSNLGNVLYEQEKYEEAIDRYLEALRLDPENPGVNVELALTYCEVGKFDLAREHYRRAMGQSGEAPAGLKAGQ